MSDFFTILTNAGQTKIAAATAGGTQVALSHLAVGSGLNNAYYTPVESQLTLKTEVWRGALNYLHVDDSNPNWIIAEVVIPAATGGFMIREAALFDTAGDMIAIGKFPETYKPTLASGSGKDILIKFVMQVSNAAAVTIQIDPSIVLAPRSYVDAEILEAMAAHRLESNPHPEYATDLDLTNHINSSDPHPAYATDANLAAHVEDTNDPHAAAEYVKLSELNTMNTAETVLTDQATITWDWATQAEGKLTISGNRSLAAPSNLASSRYATLRIVQDATGSRTLAFASNYKGVSELTLSSDPGAVDWLLFRNVDGTNCELVGYRNNVGA